MLSCSCGEWEGEPGTYAWFDTKDFIKFKASRRKRCCSCNELVEIGSDCLSFDRIRCPDSEIEARISGEEIPMSPLIMCDKCGEHYLNLHEIGYCLNPYDNMNDCLIEYQKITNFKKEKPK